MEEEQIKELKDEAVKRLNNLNKEQLEQLIIFLHNVINIDDIA